MLARNGAGPSLCGDRGGTGKVVNSIGKCKTTFKAPDRNFQEAIRAELIGSDCARACGITTYCAAPVLALCRKLIEAGHNPAAALEAWRGDTLCLIVPSIGVAADLEINSKGTDFVPLRAVRTAPPVRRKVVGHA